MYAFADGLLHSFKALVQVLRLLSTLVTQLKPFLRDVCTAFRRCFRRPSRSDCCYRLPGIYKRPDPMIYSQYWLMTQGLAVTWDNPDIELFDLVGNPAAPFDLQPDHDYKVVVRCWNNSYDAGVPVLPVHLSYLSFGIGASRTPIPGTPSTALGVKGSSTCPAFVQVIWHTPKTPGHYCLQALLECSEDANPDNNLGQKNVHVGKLHSPAMFTFVVQNEAGVRRRFELEPDIYRLPALGPCADAPPPPREGGRLAESRARWERALAVQRYGLFPVLHNWRVSLDFATFDLEPEQSREVTVAIEPEGGTFTGIQPVNIHGFATAPNGSRTLAGGITLYVQGA